MKTLFDSIVTFLTEWVTGLDSSDLSIFDLGYWFNTYNQISLIVNIVCLTLVIILGLLLIITINGFYTRFRTKKKIVKD